MTTDFRALCAELLAWAERTSAHYVVPPHVILRARAALSALEQGPTDEELLSLMSQSFRDDLAEVSRLSAQQVGTKPGVFRVSLNYDVLCFARAVLARWGRPAVEPVPQEIE